MYIDEINDLYEFVKKRFPEPNIKINKKDFKRRALENDISLNIILKLYDKINSDPAFVLEDLLYYYIGLEFATKESGNLEQFNLYSMYERVLTIMKNYILKKGEKK